MNPRQRRGVMLMLLAAIGAVAVAFGVITYTTNLRTELGDTRTVLRLTTDVAAYDMITPEMVETHEVHTASFPAGDDFLSDDSELVTPEGQPAVAAVLLHEGALLQQSMLTYAPDLATGEREIAIMVNAETGVAGKIHSGAIVDVYGLRQASEANPPCAERVLTEQTVLEIGELVSETDADTGIAQGVVPVTFRLTPQDTLRLTYAEAFMGRLRLGLVSPEGSGDPGDHQYCADTDDEEFDASGDHGPVDGPPGQQELAPEDEEPAEADGEEPQDDEDEEEDGE